MSLKVLRVPNFLDKFCKSDKELMLRPFDIVFKSLIVKAEIPKRFDSAKCLNNNVDIVRLL